MRCQDLLERILFRSPEEEFLNPRAAYLEKRPLFLGAAALSPLDKMVHRDAAISEQALELRKVWVTRVGYRGEREILLLARSCGSGVDPERLSMF